MPDISSKFIQRATRNVVDFGDTDVFPFPFENILIRRNPDEFNTIIEELSENFESHFTTMVPQFESTLVPVGYQGYRWATQICPFWNAYLLAALIKVGQKIEHSRLETSMGAVHSYRFNSNNDSSALFLSDYNWHSFMLKSYEKAQHSEYVVVTDISEFYRRIYHHRIENALEATTSSKVPKRVLALLTVFSRQSSYGLPIGDPAARMISELVINQIDHLLLSKGISFCRFSDDFHIFTKSEEDAYKAIQLLSELLILNQGLTLQKSKTRILSASEFVSTFPKHLLPGATPTSDRDRLYGLSLNFDPYSPTAEEDYSKLQKSIDQIDFLALLNEELSKSQIHSPTVTKLIKGLKVVTGNVRKNALQTLFDNVGILYPVFSQLLIVLIALQEELSEVEINLVGSRLLQLAESGSYILTLDVHKCYAVRILSKIKDHRVDALFDNWFNFGSPLLRRDILIAYVKRGDRLRLSDVKNRVSPNSPWERRALIVGSYVLGDEGKHWRKAQKFNMFEEFVQSGAGNLKQENKLGMLL